MENKFIEDNFVSCEIAVKLKELDFDEECFAGWFNYSNPSSKNNTLRCHVYKDSIYGEDATLKNSSEIYQLSYENQKSVVAENCTAPLYQQVLQWLREKHSRTIVVSSFKNIDGTEIASYFILSAEFGKINSDKFFHSYQEACVDAINTVIEIIIKSQTNERKINNI